jgi:hypothetical protein
MKSLAVLAIGAVLFLAGQLKVQAEIKVLVEHKDNEQATAAFKFKAIPPPSRTDAASQAKFSIITGEADENGGPLDKLNDGKVPSEEDQPAENFFFNAGTPGGRLLLDLGKVLELKQVNTYSWHPNSRGPQVYKLFASDGQGEGFEPKPKAELDPKIGWKLVAKVDTRGKDGASGGQYGVSIADSEGALGKYRYLLFDISKTEGDDDFGNTFYSEIDVIDNKGSETNETASSDPGIETIATDGGKYQFTVNTSETPDLRDWAKKFVIPMAREWYPRLVTMLPSEGYQAPEKFSIAFLKNMRGVASTSGTRISCAADWFERNLKGEALGAVFHEIVHVVQQYRRGRRDNPNATRAPGWLTEGIPDYIRWYIFEPEARGAEITKRNISRGYDASYRISANFLNWVVETYSKNLVPELNAAIRQGKYTDDLWKERTGHTVQELGDQWKKMHEERLAALEVGAGGGGAGAEPVQPAVLNTLTSAEKAAGWKLLFDGKTLEGWHNFKRETVRPGWQVKDGALACVDPHDAGDIVTAEQFGAFELQLDYNISEGGNSGIMYHVTDEGGAAWATGPEFQLEDNAKASDPQRCGWLYALYQPPIDPKTDKPMDATKPAGQWNHIRLLISPEKCEHEINGLKYFEYVLGSEDFKSRVAKSKFSKMPGFAKSETGRIALQGDHGQVSFRNIKVRPVQQ